MKAVIQRVQQARVVIAGEVVGEIEKGLLVLLGVDLDDNDDDIEWLGRKICQLRIFGDSDDKMNLSVLDVDGGLLLISQFTLFASTKKGNRPSFINAAKPAIADELYQKMGYFLESMLHKKIAYGTFGADMKVHLVNDGPVTIIIDSKQRV